MNKTSDITSSMSRMAESQQERSRMLQIVVTLMQKDGMTASWHPIIGYYIGTKGDLMPCHREYIYIAFEFIPGHNLMEIVRVKVTHFKEYISLN